MKTIIIFGIIFLTLCLTNTYALQIKSPTNTTYDTDNVTLIWEANATKADISIDNADFTEITEKNITYTFDNGPHSIWIKANESVLNENNETIYNATNQIVYFTVNKITIDWCNAGFDILKTHNCLTPNFTIERHECVPTKCEEMLAECQSQLTPLIKNEMYSLNSNCITSQSRINGILMDPKERLMYQVIIAILVIACIVLGVILYLKEFYAG